MYMYMIRIGNTHTDNMTGAYSEIRFGGGGQNFGYRMSYVEIWKTFFPFFPTLFILISNSGGRDFLRKL